MYHQVDASPPKGTPLRGLVVSPGSFARQMATLWAMGFKGLSMKDLMPYLQGQLSGRVFGITFDDGYENNLHQALPVLQRFGFTATCYVVAQRIGQQNEWDLNRGVPQVPLMNIADMQAWINAGQEIGSHTLTHPDLRQLSQANKQREILESKKLLEEQLYQRGGVRHFCYPYGSFDEIAIDCVEQAGYDTATTTMRGRAYPTQGRKLLAVPRVLVSRTTTCLHLLLKCLTSYEDRRRSNDVNLF